MDGRQGLLRQADELDERARGARKAEEEQLRGRAAELRIQALGEKPYPVLVCASCFKLTGWLGSGHRCDTCIDGELRRAAYEDPSGGWVDVSGRRALQPPVEAGTSGWKRAAAAVGWRGPLRAARVAVWIGHVEPGETGPIDPEEGFEIAAADRVEDAPPEGKDLLVRFYVRAVRFEGDRWQPLVGVGLPDPLTPDVFAASLPIEQLAEAWSDFRGEVDEFNRVRWCEESERRERQREAEEELVQARREQRGTSRLLD